MNAKEKNSKKKKKRNEKRKVRSDLIQICFRSDSENG